MELQPRMTSLPTLCVCLYCADQNPQRDRSLGITSYTQGLLTHLPAGGDFEVSAISSRSSFALPAGIASTLLPFRTDKTLGRMLADHLHPLFVRPAASLWHYPKGFLPAVRRARVPVVATVHDTILQFYADRYPRTRSGADLAYWLWMLKSSIARADAILTVSEFSKQAILQFCERYRISAPAVHVTYQGVNLSAAASVEPRKDDVVLHLASTLPHKRTRWLCEVWGELQERGHELPKLHLVGSLDDETAALVAKMSNVSARQTVTASKLQDLMSRARVLVLPSEIEGFGLPAVEAYHLGTPVAYVRATAVSEILGKDTPGGFDLEVDSFAEALRALLELGSAEIRLTAERLRARFAWSECIQRTVAAYRSVL
jgi:glycosyltransferase involved in cell wall biosynthesis